MYIHQPGSIIQRLCKLPRDRQGATLVEFALITPFFVLIIVGIIEISIVLLTDTLMQGALREAARFGITGAGAGDREDKIFFIIDEYTMGLVDMDTADITMRTYNDFQSVGMPEPYADDDPQNGQYDLGEWFQDVNENGVWDEDQGTPGPGVANEIVLYTISYDAPAVTGFFALFFGEDGKVRLEATLPLKNEPFNNRILMDNP